MIASRIAEVSDALCFLGVGGSGRRPLESADPGGQRRAVDEGEQLFEKKLFERNIINRKAT